MEKAQKTTKAPVKKTITSNFNSTTANVVSEVKETSEELKDVVVDTINDISEKIDFTESVDKIKDSVKTLNSQLKETTSEIVKEVKEMNEELKEVAINSVKEITKKLEVTENMEKVKVAAKNATDQITAKAEELKQTSTKLANEVLNNLNVTDRLNAIKVAVKNTNETALESTSELIDGLEKNGLKWQSLTEKAIKSGLKLAENQQNLVFTTLEAVKVQVGNSANRFKKLVTIK